MHRVLVGKPEGKKPLGKPRRRYEDVIKIGPMDALPAKRSLQPSCSHGTYKHEAITSRSRQLLMMGTWLPETC